MKSQIELLAEQYLGEINLPDYHIDIANPISVEHAANVVQTVRSNRCNSAYITESTSNKRPLKIDNVLNGLPVLRFDGTDDLMYWGPTTHSLSTFTIFCVATLSGSSIAPHFGSDATTIHTLQMDSNSISLRNPSNYVSAFTAPAGLTNADFAVGVWQKSGTTLYGRMNGYNLGTTGCDADAFLLRYFGGRQEGAWSNYFNGDFAEVIVFDNLLSEADCQLIEASLGQKWGLMNLFETNHPYYPKDFVLRLEESLVTDDFTAMVTDANLGITSKYAISSANPVIPLNTNDPVFVTLYPNYGTTWEASKDYSLGDKCFPTEPTATPYYFECATSGISDATEPTWDTGIGNTTTDNAATWTCIERMVQPVTHGPLTPQSF